MPIQSREVRTRSGHPVLRSDYQPEVTAADAQAFIDRVKPGTDFEHHGHLIVGGITSVSKEARQVLESQKADERNPLPVALVLNSAVMRMVAGLATRLSNNDNNEFFKTESEALAWLDGRMAAYLAKRAQLSAPKR